MASQLQRRKVAVVFDAMDTDHDGFLGEADFRELAARWSATREWEPGSEHHERLVGLMTGWWDVLAASDLDQDDRVTLDEVWSEFWSGDDPDAPGTWVFGRFDLPATSRR